MSVSQFESVVPGSEDELLRMSMAAQPSAETQARFDEEKALGNTAYREQRYQDAVRHYTNAENLNPCSPVPPANRAMANLRLHKYSEVETDVTCAIALQDAGPRQQGHHTLRVKLHLRRATARMELAVYTGAAEDYAAVIRIEPANRDAKTALEELRTLHGVVPPQVSSAASRQSPMINVIGEGEAVNGIQHPPGHGHANGTARASAHANGSRVEQNDAPLLPLSSSALRDLTSKWSEIPPQNAFEFERAWKSLRENDTARAHYIAAVVGAESIKGGLLGHGLTAQLLLDIVVALSAGNIHDQAFRDQAKRVLHALTELPRFDIAVMLMSPAEKNRVAQLLAKLEDGCAPSQQTLNLRRAYQCAPQ